MFIIFSRFSEKKRSISGFRETETRGKVTLYLTASLKGFVFQLIAKVLPLFLREAVFFVSLDTEAQNSSDLLRRKKALIMKLL